MAGFPDGIRSAFGTQEVIIIHKEGLQDETLTPRQDRSGSTAAGRIARCSAQFRCGP
jgi:hypothetical protein